MLRVPSPVLDAENNQLVYKDRMENNQNETSKIHHKTKNLSFSISSILQVCTQRSDTMINDGSNIKRERRIERFDNNAFFIK